MSEDLISIDIYPDIAFEEDLTPDCGVEIDDIVEQIHSACKGFGTNEDLLIQTLGSTTPEDRLKIRIRYKDLHEKELKDVMNSETSGDFGMVLKMCSYGPVEAECYMIRQACKGFGCHQAALYSILCGRSNREMELLKKTYYKMYTKDLSSLISSELKGDLWKLVSSCLQAAAEEYDPDYHTKEKAVEDAEDFYKAGQGRWGTNENQFFKIVALAPRKHLKVINEVYADKYGYTLAKAMEKELSGKATKAAIFTCNMRLKPYEAISHLIKSACAGLGTDEFLLTCCIIRYQNIMGQVNFTHEEIFGKSVHDRVRDECSKNYEKILLALLNKVFPEE